MNIPKTVFVFALLTGFIYLLYYTVHAKAEKCLQFGNNVFEGPDGNCYSCPVGFTTKKNPTDKRITLNSLGVPVCTMNKTKPMNLIRKTVSQANVIPGGYAGTVVVEDNLSNVEFKGSFTKPIDIMTQACPDGYTRNPNKPPDSSQACQASCPPGSSPDENSGLCYSCPEGYVRTSADITGKGACKKPCSPGSFEVNYYDSGYGKCYKCPDGYTRTKEPIDSGKACFIECPGFTSKNQCYKCPDGYVKNTNALSPDEACYKPCSADGSNIFESRETQSCYECPVGYTKDPTQNVSPFNSLSCINRQEKPANLISTVGADGRMVPPEVVQGQLQNVKKIII